MKKVLHIIDTLGLGGAQTVVKGIAERSAETNASVFALRQTKVSSSIFAQNVVIYDSTSKYSIKVLFALKKFIKVNHIEVIHCHLMKSQIMGLVLKNIWFRHTTLVFHEHGKVFRSSPLYSLFLKISSHSVDSFIAISKATESRLLRYIPRVKHKVSVLYNFVDLKRFVPVTRDENEHFLVGFAARITENKGWREFLEAAAILKNTHRDVRFIIAGTGKEEPELKSQIEALNIADIVTYKGYVRDMPAFYGSLDCFVVPSHWEPMGMTELEAQAMGIPVIASDIEGLNEVINDQIDCLLFEAKNSAELAEKIALLEVDSQLRARLQAGSIMNAKWYSLTEYIHNLEKIYGGIETK